MLQTLIGCQLGPRGDNGWAVDLFRVRRRKDTGLRYSRGVWIALYTCSPLLVQDLVDSNIQVLNQSKTLSMGVGGGFDSFGPESRKFLGSSRASWVCDRELAHEGNAERICMKRSASTPGIRFDGRQVVEVMATGAVSSCAPRVERGLLKTG